MKAKKYGFGSRKGQGIVEFALAFPVFLLIVLGIFEFGRLMFTYATVFTASREAARFGATVTNAVDCAGMEAAATNVAIFTDVSQIKIYYDDGLTNLNAIAGDPNPVETLDGLGLDECGERTDAEVVLGDRIIVVVSTQYMPVVGPFVGIKEDFIIRNLVSRTLVKEVKWDNPNP